MLKHFWQAELGIGSEDQTEKFTQGIPDGVLNVRPELLPPVSYAETKTQCTPGESKLVEIKYGGETEDDIITEMHDCTHQGRWEKRIVQEGSDSAEGSNVAKAQAKEAKVREVIAKVAGLEKDSTAVAAAIGSNKVLESALDGTKPDRNTLTKAFTEIADVTCQVGDVRGAAYKNAEGMCVQDTCEANDWVAKETTGCAECVDGDTLPASMADDLCKQSICVNGMWSEEVVDNTMCFVGGGASALKTVDEIKATIKEDSAATIAHKHDDAAVETTKSASSDAYTGAPMEDDNADTYAGAPMEDDNADTYAGAPMMDAGVPTDTYAGAPMEDNSGAPTDTYAGAPMDGGAATGDNLGPAAQGCARSN